MYVVTVFSRSIQAGEQIVLVDTGKDMELNSYFHHPFSAYTVSNLLEDIKLMYRRAGLEGNGVVFEFNDKNIKDEIFLDYINNILMGGMVGCLIILVNY